RGDPGAHWHRKPLGSAPPRHPRDGRARGCPTPGAPPAAQEERLMARGAGGTVFEQPADSGRYFGRFTTTRGRKTVRLFACANLGEARERTEFIAGELQRLREAGCEEHAPQLF